jgi:transposase
MALFPPARLGGEKVEYGYKDKGSTLHLITDEKGHPLAIQLASAKEDERKQIKKLLKMIKALLPKDQIIFLEADKGYDSRQLRVELLAKGIYPLIAYKKNKSPIASWIKKVRWKVERSISWMKRAYRRIATRWERLADAFMGIIFAALCFYWVRKIVG